MTKVIKVIWIETRTENHNFAAAFKLLLVIHNSAVSSSIQLFPQFISANKQNNYIGNISKYFHN